MPSPSELISSHEAAERFGVHESSVRRWARVEKISCYFASDGRRFVASEIETLLGARTPLNRFWSSVNKTDLCWLWTAGRDGHGYGKFSIGQKRYKAHRWLYEQVNGPIPGDLPLDHLCRVTRCVNPNHLEPVTTRENILRGQSFAAKNAKKTHCRRGHAYDATNTYTDRSGSRHCRACKRARDAARIAARKASA